MIRRGESSGALFSPCGRWRRLLWRIWNDTQPLFAFCGMNPSKAGASWAESDNTVDRMIERARRGGFGGLLVANAFSFIETDSTKLDAAVLLGTDIVGPENDDAIVYAAKAAPVFVCGWGRPGRLLNRHDAVLDLLRKANIVPHAFKLNADGTPQHPLYLPYALQPRRWWNGKLDEVAA